MKTKKQIKSAEKEFREFIDKNNSSTDKNDIIKTRVVYIAEHILRWVRYKDMNQSILNDVLEGTYYLTKENPS